MTRTAVVRTVLVALVVVVAVSVLWVWMGDDSVRASVVQGAGLVLVGLAMLTFAFVHWRRGR